MFSINYCQKNKKNIIIGKEINNISFVLSRKPLRVLKDKKDITNDIERKIDIICNEFKPAAKKEKWENSIKVENPNSKFTDILLSEFSFKFKIKITYGV